MGHPDGARAVLGSLRMIFEETGVAVVRLPHGFGRAAARLGEKQVNYGGLETGSSVALVVFAVDNLAPEEVRPSA